jgi:hypothetical protein
MARFGLVLLVLSGCVLDPHRQTRQTRFVMAAQSHRLHAQKPVDDFTARESTPAMTESIATGAYTGSGQLTLRAWDKLVYGFELEAGRLDKTGSNFAGAYGVLGAEHVTGWGMVGVEVASGWRGIRYRHGLDDDNSIIAEPRVRAQYRLGSQVTMGAVAGATIGELGTFMAGIFIGFDAQPVE